MFWEVYANLSKKLGIGFNGVLQEESIFKV